MLATDIWRIVIGYVSPCKLSSLFIRHNLDFGIKFMYDMSEQDVGVDVINKMMIFKGIIITGMATDYYNPVSDTIKSWNYIERMRFSNIYNVNDILKKCVNIKYLYLENIIINDTNYLMNFEKLRLISTCGCKWVHGSDLFLSKCINLRVIKFSSLVISLRDARIFSECRNLRSLEIGGIVDKVMLNCEKLKYFKISGKVISRDRVYDLKFLMGCRNLRYVKLVRCYWGWRKSLEIPYELKNLRFVKLVECDINVDLIELYRRGIKVSRKYLV